MGDVSTRDTGFSRFAESAEFRRLYEEYLLQPQPRAGVSDIRTSQVPRRSSAAWLCR